ncbi:hypothetical protein SLS62_001967 [Diatrype stigma]|uniref:DUF1993 domain-containing protein n=1 Tax=Diatrype stigma TaxID=117547 RepID=A0AAN9UUY5_9PEZI
MASISFYDVSVGSYTRALKVLLRILNKAAATQADPSLLDARLAPDMYPLARQVEIAAMFAGELAEAVTGRKLVPWVQRANGEPGWGPEPNRHAGDSSSPAWADATGLVEQALEILEKEVGTPSSPAVVVDARVAAEGVQLPMRIAGETFATPAAECVLANGLPNVLFHVYTAYAILRSRGVALGKIDVLLPFAPERVADELVGKGLVAA